MTTPAEHAVDNHGRVARIVSLSLVSLYALVALGWAVSAPNAEEAATAAEPTVASSTR